MPRKRIRFKKKFNVEYDKLTEDLYEAICHSASLEEMLGGYKHLGYHKHISFKKGYYFMFDKNDPKVCRKIWNLHKKAVMERWKAEGNAGSRPFLWWVCERPEEPKIIRYEKHMNNSDTIPEPVELPDGSIEAEYPIWEDSAAYLKRLNLLEAWEIKAFERPPDFKEEPPGFEEEEGTEFLPY